MATLLFCGDSQELPKHVADSDEASDYAAEVEVKGQYDDNPTGE
jgi:hypothetical protein